MEYITIFIRHHDGAVVLLDTDGSEKILSQNEHPSTIMKWINKYANEGWRAVNMTRVYDNRFSVLMCRQI